MLLTDRIVAELAAGAELMASTALMLALCYSPRRRGRGRSSHPSRIFSDLGHHTRPNSEYPSSAGEDRVRAGSLSQTPSPARAFGIPPSQAERGSAHDDLSQGSVRFGHPALALTYSFAWDSINGITLSLIGSIQSDALVHLVPSHCAR